MKTDREALTALHDAVVATRPIAAAGPADYIAYSSRDEIKRVLKNQIVIMEFLFYLRSGLQIERGLTACDAETPVPPSPEAVLRVPVVLPTDEATGSTE